MWLTVFVGNFGSSLKCLLRTVGEIGRKHIRNYKFQMSND
jgi:hypothetical protein